MGAPLTMAECRVRMNGRGAMKQIRDRLESERGETLGDLVAALEALATPDGTPAQGAALLRASGRAFEIVVHGEGGAGARR